MNSEYVSYNHDLFMFIKKRLIDFSNFIRALCRSITSLSGNREEVDHYWRGMKKKLYLKHSVMETFTPCGRSEHCMNVVNIYLHAYVDFNIRK